MYPVLIVQEFCAPLDAKRQHEVDRRNESVFRCGRRRGDEKDGVIYIYIYCIYI